MSSLTVLSVDVISSGEDTVSEISDPPGGSCVPTQDTAVSSMRNATAAHTSLDTVFFRDILSSFCCSVLKNAYNNILTLFICFVKMSWLCADILSGRSEFQKKITVKFLGLQKYFLKSRQKLLTRRKKNGIISPEIKKNSPFSPCRTASLVNIFLLPQWVKCEARSFSSCILFCPAFFSEVNYNSNKRYSRQ